MSTGLYNALLHTHSAAWLVMVILFVISYFKGNNKVLPMILRLFYLIMLVTGSMMLYALSFPVTYVIKAILAIILIGFMEVILGRKSRREPHAVFWGIWAVLLLGIVFIGYDVVSYF